MSMQVPEFLLRRLYVEGSLTNADDGFSFKLENMLGSGYAEALEPLRIDGEELPLDDVSFTIEGEDGGPTPFSAVTKEQPFTLEQGKTTTIHARAKRLGPGEHTIRLGFLVAGLGEMALEVSDTLAE